MPPLLGGLHQMEIEGDEQGGEQVEHLPLTAEQIAAKEAELGEFVTLGRRSLILGEFSKAVDVLSKAAETASQLYGDQGCGSFEAMLLYGRALLEVGKGEGPVVDGVGNKPVVEKSEKDSPEEKTAEEDAEEQDGEDGANEGSDDEEVGEEENTMQEAWYVLENARFICTKHMELEDISEETRKEWKLRKAEVLCFTAEVQAYDAVYEDALADINEAIKLQSECLSEDSKHRVLAVTYHTQSKVHRFKDDFEEAVVSLGKARDLIMERISLIETMLIPLEGDARKPHEDEVVELRGVLKDLEDLVTETENTAKTTKEMHEAMKAEMREGMNVLASIISKSTVSAGQEDIAGSSKEPENLPANDITAMMRKKRNAEENLDTSSQKKAKDDQQE